jgi:hypothetical protein
MDSSSRLRRPYRSASQPATGENSRIQIAGMVRMPPMTQYS